MAELSEQPLCRCRRLHGGATVVRVSGEIDLSTVGGLRAPLDELAGEGLVAVGGRLPPMLSAPGRWRAHLSPPTQGADPLATASTCVGEPLRFRD